MVNTVEIVSLISGVIGEAFAVHELKIGEEAYNAEQIEQRQILDRLLLEYNDGRKKTLFCLAVNLLPLEDLRLAFEDGDQEMTLEDWAKKMEKSPFQSLL